MTFRVAFTRMKSIRGLVPFRRAAPAAAAGALAFGLWLSGCNLFSPLAADNRNDLTYDGLVFKGNEAFNAGDYAGAESYYRQAIDLNQRGSEAYLFESKALMKEYNLGYSQLNDEFTRHQNKDGHPGVRGVPFIDSTTTLAGIDSVYYPIATSVQNLEHILRKEKDTIRLDENWVLPPDGDTAGDGRISDGVARLDLGLLQAVKAVLAPLDLDGNNRIDSACGRNICPALDATCMATAAYKAKCENGPLSEVLRFASFKKLTQHVSLDSLNTADVNPRDISTNPNDINAFLSAMQAPIAASNFNLDSVTGTMNSHGEKALSGQLGGVVGNIHDLNNFLNYMRYADRLDDDFDSQDTSKTSVKTPMLWHDYNKDGGIMFSYDDTARYAGLPGETGNIGYPVHRYKRPELYLTFAEYKQAYPKAAADTDTTGAPSRNSRLGLMIKHCQDIVNGLLNTPAYNALALKMIAHPPTCSTITTVLRPEVRPPPHSDWIGGTAGVDEEEIDQRDNDYDGLQDEDARNLPGFDDDDDALLNTSMIGKPVAPMVWNDVPGHENLCLKDNGNKTDTIHCACPDIDVTQPMLPLPFQRQFCIGALENRIWMVQTYGIHNSFDVNDTLKSYYSHVSAEGAARNCLEDYLKLPKAYRVTVDTASTVDALGQVVQSACKYKHIWIHGIPPHSEWTSGVFGVDEEKLDGVDNDGDGWIDEDVNAQ